MRCTTFSRLCFSLCCLLVYMVQTDRRLAPVATQWHIVQRDSALAINMASFGSVFDGTLLVLSRVFAFRSCLCADPPRTMLRALCG